MSKFTHYNAALKSAFYGHLTAFKLKHNIRRRPTSRVMHQGIEHAVGRYARICRTLLDYLPNPNSLEGTIVSEIGCGDCFAAADMMLGLGARHVHLVEFLPLELSEQNRQALNALVGMEGLPNRGEVMASDEPLRLNPQQCTYHQGLLENIQLPEKIDLLYSFDVLEHVEDLDGFFAYCGEVVKPGGIMVHKFDLSGHGLFEDPMPPLDFQVYPRWLYDLLFPKQLRAVGNFADQFLNSMRKHGFEDLQVKAIRVAEETYLNEIWPHLRKEARQREKQTVALLDLVVTGRRKA